MICVSVPGRSRGGKDLQDVLTLNHEWPVEPRLGNSFKHLISQRSTGSGSPMLAKSWNIPGCLTSTGAV